MIKMKTKIIRMPQVGNCLFDAISYGIYKNIDKSSDFRKLAVSYIGQNKDFFVNFLESDIDKYLYSISQNGTYGDELTIVALSKSLKAKIIVISSETKKIINTYNYGKYKIYLLYNSDYEHYDYLSKFELS